MITVSGEALLLSELMAAARHGAASSIERCFHWLLQLDRSSGPSRDEAAAAIRELETELRVLEVELRQLDAALEARAR